MSSTKSTTVSAQQTQQIISESFALGPKTALERMMNPDSPGSYGSEPARPVKTFTGSTYQIVGRLKGNVGGDGWVRTPDGTDCWKFTDDELAAHCGVSKTTLQRYGKEIWGHRRPMPEKCGCALCRSRVFNPFKLVGADGCERWMLQYRPWAYHWINEPKQPELAALERELAEISDGYQTPRKWHATPFGIIPDNGTLEYELPDGKVLHFPTGELVERPARFGGSYRQIGGSKRQSGGSLKKKVLRHTEITPKSTEKRAAPQAAPSHSAKLSIQKLVQKIDADQQLYEVWYSDGLAHGIDINTSNGEAVCAKFLRYYKKPRTLDDWRAKWRTWCAQER